MILLGTAMSALVLYVLCKVGLTNPGYQNLGVYTLLMIGFVMVVFCYQLIRKINVPDTEPASDQSESKT